MDSLNYLLSVRHMKKYFPLGKSFFSGKRGFVYAVDDVSFNLREGETLGFVGESGCGKTTIGRCILRLIEPTDGKIIFEGTELTKLAPKRMNEIRKKIQIIFQDPYGSLTPRMRIRSILREPLDIHNIGTVSEKKQSVESMIEKVGIRPEQLDRFPHEFSGGQRQRIAIARALMLQPKIVIADEPVSALDVSIQAQIINLMVRLQKTFKLSYLLISHDLSVVKYMCDRVAVMYLGKIVEIANNNDLYENPLHPYTEALLAAVPVIKEGSNREQIYLGGEIPSPIAPPKGCGFHTRCRYKTDICERVKPTLNDYEKNHFVACHLKC